MTTDPRDGARHAASSTIAVLVETTPKRAFASALEWPGWSRSGRDEDAALAALARYAGRFGPVAAAAGAPLPAAEPALVVAERLPGTPTTAFGAPDVVARADRRPVDGQAGVHLAALVEAAWATLDSIVAVSPQELRKGPRGGGRNRDKLVAHVVAAEQAYSRIIGVRLPEPDPTDRRAVLALRAAILDALREPSDGSGLAGKKWPARYAARRIAWHVLDHAWEMEDRSKA